MSIKIVLPYPPSTNRMWRKWQGRMVLSAEGRQYKEDAQKIARAALGPTAPLEGGLFVTILVYRKIQSGDLDNRLKLALDCLKGAAYGDDAQVVEIYMQRHDDPDFPRIEITVEESTIGLPSKKRVRKKAQ